MIIVLLKIFIVWLAFVGVLKCYCIGYSYTVDKEFKTDEDADLIRQKDDYEKKIKQNYSIHPCNANPELNQKIANLKEEIRRQKRRFDKLTYDYQQLLIKKAPWTKYDNDNGYDY